MAGEIKTVFTYNLDGATTDFNIPFEYLARKFVVVTLIGVDRKVLVLNSDYRFATKTTISLFKAWGAADGYQQIEIRRYTSATERLVDFTDGSILRAYDLNIAQLQTIHVAEEARDLTADTIGVNNDGDLDARGRRIVNIADAKVDSDAVSLRQVKNMSQGAWQSRNEAEQFKNEAKGFKDEAKTSSDKAATSEANSANSAAKAKEWATSDSEVESGLYSSKHYAGLTANDRAAAFQSKEAAERARHDAQQAQQHAANSQAAAATSAQDAFKEAERAKTEADKLGGWNTMASNIDAERTVEYAEEGGMYSEGLAAFKSPTLSYANHLLKINGSKVAGAPELHTVCGSWRDPSSANPDAFFELYQVDKSTGKRMNAYRVDFKSPDKWGEGTTWGNIAQHVWSGHSFKFNQGAGSTDTAVLSAPRFNATTGNNGFNIQASSGQSCYYLGTRAGANLFYVGVGSAGTDDTSFYNYKHSTVLNLQKDQVQINKNLQIGATGRVHSDGNVFGSKWGNQWLDAYIKNNYVINLRLSSPKNIEIGNAKGWATWPSGYVATAFNRRGEYGGILQVQGRLLQCGLGNGTWRTVTYVG